MAVKNVHVILKVQLETGNYFLIILQNVGGGAGGRYSWRQDVWCLHRYIHQIGTAVWGDDVYK